MCLRVCVPYMRPLNASCVTGFRFLRFPISQSSPFSFWRNFGVRRLNIVLEIKSTGFLFFLCSFRERDSHNVIYACVQVGFKNSGMALGVEILCEYFRTHNIRESFLTTRSRLTITTNKRNTPLITYFIITLRNDKLLAWLVQRDRYIHPHRLSLSRLYFALSLSLWHHHHRARVCNYYGRLFSSSSHSFPLTLSLLHHLPGSFLRLRFQRKLYIQFNVRLCAYRSVLLRRTFWISVQWCNKCEWNKLYLSHSDSLHQCTSVQEVLREKTDVILPSAPAVDILRSSIIIARYIHVLKLCVCVRKYISTYRHK